MQSFIQKLRFPALTFLIAGMVLFYYFHEVLIAPNSYLFASGGDGVKNYYSYMFHATHDSGFWQFGGMNYPYYEHIVYTDAHPLLSWVIGELGLENYGIGILNTFMLLSYPICAVFLFLILKNYRVETPWAIAAAVAITFLAPQLGRLHGHFALSYVFAIPVMWWILIQCRKGSPAIWSVVSFLYIMSFFFTHPYLGVILGLFSAVFWLVVYLYNRGEWKNAIGFTSMQLIIPFLLFRIILFATDPHLNRIDTPAGFYNFFGAWSSVIAAPYGPLNDFINLIGVRLKSWETWAYVGASTLMFFLLTVGYATAKRKTLPLKLLLRHDLFKYFITATILLIFSFCFPFKFEWFRWIPDNFGPLKQFRVLGRFGWVFFYITTIASVVAFYHIYNREGKPFKYALIFYVGIAFYFVETNEVLTQTADAISLNKNSFNKKSLDPSIKETAQFIKSSDYDAFIMLPFTHMSSENMMILGEEKANFEAFMISFHTGIPMLNSVSSRLSQSESIKFNNFFGPEFIEKELLKDIPEDKKIAIIINDEYLNENELRLYFSHNEQLRFENEVFKVFEFNRDVWNTDFYYKQVMDEYHSAQYNVGQGWKSTDKNTWFAYESWNKNRSEGLKGKGGFNRKKMDFDVFYFLETDSMDNGEYIASFWYNHYIDRADVMAIAEMKYSDQEETQWVSTCDIKESTHIVGNWMYCELKFKVTDQSESVKLLIAGNRSREPYVLDELLIRKANSPPLFSEGKIGGTEYIIYNNYWIKKGSFSKENL